MIALERTPQADARGCHLHVRPAVDTPREALESLVDHTAGGWLSHLPQWARLCEDALGYRDLSFVVADEEQPQHRVVGVCPLAFRRVLGFHLLESAAFGAYGSPLIADALPLVLVQEVWPLMARHIEATARSLRVDRVVMRPFPNHDRVPHQAWRAAGFHAEPYHVYTVDLDRPLDELRRRCADNVRHAIGQAQRYGVQVVCEESDEGIETFYSLFRETYERTGAKPIPRDYFIQLWRFDGGRGNRVRLFVAQHAGTAVAAALITMCRDWAVYCSNGSSRAGLRLRANNLLQWEIFRWLKAHGIRWYELGHEEPGVPSAKQGQIDFFVTRFGVERFPAVRWLHDMRPVRCRGYDVARRLAGRVRGR